MVLQGLERAFGPGVEEAGGVRKKRASVESDEEWCREKKKSVVGWGEGRERKSEKVEP